MRTRFALLALLAALAMAMTSCAGDPPSGSGASASQGSITGSMARISVARRDSPEVRARSDAMARSGLANPRAASRSLAPSGSRPVGTAPNASSSGR